DGFFVGGGIETRLGPTNWFARLEYRFSQFDSERIFRDDEDEDLRMNVEPTMHTGRLTLTYKFTPGFGWGSWGRGWSNNY
ncbi:MAG TPA: hypothetical protein VFZ16_12645, partial [Hyphomicrobiaceae bacterium]|nr:hypothetical protein [Hyphomicrobiaceae bacterium]